MRKLVAFLEGCAPSPNGVHQGVSLAVASGADVASPASLDVNGLPDIVSQPVSVNLLPMVYRTSGGREGGAK